MKSFVWIATNLIGLFILAFIYFRREKTPGKRTKDQTLFECLLLSVMAYLVTDTTGQMLDSQIFAGASILHNISTVIFYLTSILPGYFYLLYCDNKVFAGSGNVKKRTIIYSIPVAINTIISVTAPLTHILYTINENNVYVRGALFFVPMAISFAYVLLSLPLLAVKTKRKPSLPIKGVNLYYYLFPFPPVISAVFQFIYSDLLIVGIGLVIASFIIFLASLQSSQDKRSLSVRFLNINIIQFALIAFILTIGVILVLDTVTEEISMDYAQYNSISAVNLFEAYINKEIGVIGTAANSYAIKGWFDDESNLALKQAAFDEFTGLMHMLYSDNLYMVVEKPRHAFVIEAQSTETGFGTALIIDEDDPSNEWYFAFKQSPFEYELNIDVDNINNRKAVWLNYKVLDNNGDMLGAITVGMDLSGIAERVFSQFDNKRFRGFIIDENGIIQMDSMLLGSDDVLMFGIEKSIFDEIQYEEFHEALRVYLDNISSLFNDLSKVTTIVSMHSEQHRYATITPISSTYWSVIKLYDSSALFDVSKLLPLLLILGIVFILFTFSTNRITQRLIFMPIKNLVDSLIKKRSNKEQALYGMERSDEIGLLSNTIQEYYETGYHDGLTGIFNRRYFEMTFEQIMNTLSRTESSLSVMMMDVDHFKKYNDTYGHAEGDHCLKAIAETLEKSMQRKGDFAARYGGEEFVVVLPGTDEVGAKAVAESILSSIRDLKIPHEKNPEGNFVVTISIGIATGSSKASHSGDDYLKKADEALYLSKENGRNTAMFLEMK